MTKFGLLIDLVNIALKLIVGFGLLRMAMKYKESVGIADGMDYPGNAVDDVNQFHGKRERIYPQPNMNSDIKQMRDDEEYSEQY